MPRTLIVLVCPRTFLGCVGQVESHLKLLNSRIKNMIPEEGAQAKLLEDYEVAKKALEGEVRLYSAQSGIS